jgi:predicted DNA-binding transcriptional regulator AlpA
MDASPLARLLTEAEVAELIGVKPATLRNWRCQNRGPVGRKIGSNVRYPESAVADWLEKQPVVGGIF